MAARKELTDDLRLAHVLADNADSITLARFRAQDLRVEHKPDLSEVTDADRGVEEAIRRTLSSSRPRDAVHGEEGEDTGWGPRRWVIDPIDGTANFVRGVPAWAPLIALMVEDRGEVGVVSAPLLGRRWWACTDGGAFSGKSLMSPTPMRVSNVSSLSDAFLSYSSLKGWVDAERGLQFGDLMRTVWRTRAFGDFWSHMLVGEGAVDISAEPEVSLWDLAALQVIVQEAGGRFTDLSGVASPDGGSVVCTNGHLHEEVLAHLADSTKQSLPAARY